MSDFLLSSFHDRQHYNAICFAVDNSFSSIRRHELVNKDRKTVDCIDHDAADAISAPRISLFIPPSGSALLLRILHLSPRKAIIWLYQDAWYKFILIWPELLEAVVHGEGSRLHARVVQLPQKADTYAETKLILPLRK